jgi:carbonic anhydrase
MSSDAHGAPATERLLENARRYAETFQAGALPPAPATGVAVLTCMDARLNVYGLLGLREGDAHVIRNAGGVVTDDAIRSLAVSQRLLGTAEIILIHHTDCGLRTVSDASFRRAVEEDTGVRPPWAVEVLPDVDEDVRRSIRLIRESPFLLRTDAVRGFVYDVRTGRLREVE